MNTKNHLKVGAAQADITPQKSMHLVGMGREFDSVDGDKFSYTKRDNPTEKVHDPLMIQATFLNHGSKKVIILVADLLYTVALDEVRAAVSKACEIPESAVFYCSTHNHNGPCLTEEYSEFLCKKAVKSALEAISDAKPAMTEFVSGHYDRLSYDRAEPWGQVDGSVDVVKFIDTENYKLITMWWNYGCHPCSMSWDFNEISADYPGVLRRKVSEIFETQVPITFFLSGAGNVQISGMKRFVNPPNMFLGVPKGSFEMVEQLGSCIAEAGLKAFNGVVSGGLLTELNFENYCIELPVKTEFTVAELQERKKSILKVLTDGMTGLISDTPFEKEVSKISIEWIDELISQGSNKEIFRKIAGGYISLGNIAIIFSPFELAWQITSRIKERSPFCKTLISTTSLGFESYLTESKFYDLEMSKRPYESFGLQALAGYSYTSKSPKIFEDEVIAKL